MLHLKTFAAAIFFLISTPQPSEPLADFEIKITIKGNDVEFNGLKGCSFNMLSFAARRTVVLNENGMVSPDDDAAMTNSDFLIQYSKHGKRIKLSGMKGVAWKELTFSTNAVIDEHGVK